MGNGPANGWEFGIIMGGWVQEKDNNNRVGFYSILLRQFGNFKEFF